jgi:hypothetical protein
MEYINEQEKRNDSGKDWCKQTGIITQHSLTFASNISGTPAG